MECSGNRFRSQIIVVLLSIAFYTPAIAQDSLAPATVDEVRWEKAMDERVYDEKSNPDKAPSDFNTDLPSANLELGWVQYLLIVLLMVGIIALLIKLLSQKENTKVNGNEAVLEEIDRADENLAEADLNRLLDRALALGDHRAALRIHYLMVLKLLDTKGWVKHRKDKTNMAYIMELSGRKEQADFRTLTRVFELVWYGDHPLTDQDYIHLRPRYESFTSELNKP